MSEKYDEYLREHFEAVAKAAAWMVENLLMDKRDRSALVHQVSVHDVSKNTPDEYDAYDAWFYGEKDVEAFNRAWLHHIHNNPHHWQHWVLVNGYGKFGDPGVVTALEMPKVYVLEMIADWWSFSWKSGNLHEVFGWYEDHKDKIVLHPNTREYVERILGEIKSKLEEDG